MWQSRYIIPDEEKWLSRPDIPANMTFAQQIKLVNLLDEPLPKPDEMAFAFLGFKSDEGIKRNLGRPGAVAGPDAIRQALAKIALNRKDISCYDFGDIACFDGDLEKAQSALAEVVTSFLHKNYIPILLGGGHEIAWGHYQGIVKHFAKKKLGIVNFDAHFDMRPTVTHGATSGTPFLQIAEEAHENKRRFSYSCLGIQPGSNIDILFSIAKKYKVNFLLAEDIYLKGLKNATSIIKRACKQNDIVYASICLDVFAGCYAPGVSAPQPLGLTPWQIIPLLRQLAQSGKVKTYDLAELSPSRDIDQITAKLAAYLIFEIVHSQR